MESDDGNCGAHGGDIKCDQQAAAQLVAYAALWHQSEAEAGLGEALLRGEAIDQDDFGGVEAGADQLARQDVTRGIGFAGRRRKANPSFAGEHARIAQKTTGKHVVAGSDHHHRLTAGIERHKPGAISGEIAQTQACIAAPDQIAHLAAGRGAQQQPNVPGPARKAPQRVDDMRVGERPDERERNRAAQTGLQSEHRLAPILERSKRRLGVRQEGPASLGEAHVATDAFEHRRAELLLQEPEATADRRLRTMQPPGSAGEAAEFGNCDEGLDLSDVHRSGILMVRQNIMHLTDGQRQLKFARGEVRTETRAMASQNDKAMAFRALHERRGAFIMPNPWDAGTAKLLTALGFEALATTSLGLANMLGRADSAVTRDEVVANCRDVVAATDLPVNADLENCFAHAPQAAAEAIRLAAEAGAVGGSIEDFTGNAADPIYDLNLAVARVRAAAAVARSLPVPFLLTARAENLIRGRNDMADTISRLQAYEAAGADVLYAPGLRTLAEARDVVAAVKRPVNVVSGWIEPGITAAQLAEAGAKRIGVGGALSRLTLATFIEAARAMRVEGSFVWMRKMASIGELQRMFAGG